MPTVPGQREMTSADRKDWWARRLNNYRVTAVDPGGGGHEEVAERHDGLHVDLGRHASGRRADLEAVDADQRADEAEDHLCEREHRRVPTAIETTDRVAVWPCCA